MVLQTPLRSRHEALGARLVPFGGWNMPVQYGPILDEARLVRSKVGLFDLCHMGRYTFEGPGAEGLLQRVLTNDLSKIKPGVIRYALICQEDGTVIDDVLVYRDPETPENFLLVVNAANRDKDMDWIVSHSGDYDCKITDRSEELAMLALQGPRSIDTLQRICDIDLSSLGYYKWAYGEVLGVESSISRTGYTGEDGFEVYFPAEKAEAFWDALLEAGTEFGIAPIGLGARDTLRLEAGMSLYGHEIDETIHPLEAGLSWAVRLGKDFIGRDALARIKEEGLSRKLVGLLCEGRRVPRQGYEIASDGTTVGHICSGTWSPVKESPIATGYLPLDLAEPGTRVDIMVKDKIIPGEVVPLPFYKRES
jgi:glycine cleavage system T protein (aminomethyltransferase)